MTIYAEILSFYSLVGKRFFINLTTFDLSELFALTSGVT
ncbi:hypothetical protein VVMO6_00691 [Vibrio vulnificus MO6-24/O]|nr:hypothetical protein VVMO6_00691 [Vibrio vulnificus MO6-24/O]